MNTEILDIIKDAELLTSDLRNAEDCESAADFAANLENAIDHARTILADLLTLKDPS